jgi:CDP-glycerol glycerophosphotransferase
MNLSAYSPTRIIGALNRRRLDFFRNLRYQSAKSGNLQDSVLFESFQGKVIGDNPLDIFHELKKQRSDLKFFWTVQKNKTQAPAGSTAVIHGSAQWLKLLATSKYLVNNTNFPWYFRKSTGQIYLQTWHGTPLKRLGRDIPGNSLTASYLNTMDREATYWNALISPNKYCTDIFPKAFNFSGRIIETGYPRNDRLKNDTGEIRARVRNQLGIKDEQTTLILYAPTWRDYKRSATGAWLQVNFMEQAISLPTNSKLAYRGHTNTHSSRSKPIPSGAIDVTNYPDVTELYLAADVLVTDYSSVMFDFSVTGKPIIILAPDISEYQAKRGFYFDFLGEVPGPVCTSNAELVQALAHLKTNAKNFSEKYSRWQAKFNHREDGRAAQRVVSEIFLDSNHS